MMFWLLRGGFRIILHIHFCLYFVLVIGELHPINDPANETGDAGKCSYQNAAAIKYAVSDTDSIGGFCLAITIVRVRIVLLLERESIFRGEFAANGLRDLCYDYEMPNKVK